MKRRNLFVIAGTIVVLTAFLFLRGHLFSASEGDLLFHTRSVDATRLHLPEPGKAYAFHHSSGYFKATPLCTRRSMSALFEEPETFQGENSVGVSYNGAVENMSAVLNETIIEMLVADDARRIWNLNKKHQQSAGGKFPETCISVLVTHVRDAAYDVFIVETVYYAQEDPTDPFMVKFEPKPFVLDGCDKNCASAKAGLLELLRPDWATKIKANIIRVFNI